MPLEKQFDREVVLDRAMQAFWSRGYAATSIQDIVDSTGINRASLYATYGDKHALFLQSLRMFDDRQRRQSLADLEARYAPREAIRRLFLAYTGPVAKDCCSRGCFLTNSALELAAHDAEVRAIVVRAQREIEAFFARLIDAGKAADEIAGHIPTKATASGLLASMIGVVVLTRSRPEPDFLTCIVEDAMSRLT